MSKSYQQIIDAYETCFARYEDPDDAEYSEWIDWIKIKLRDVTLSELTGFDMVVSIPGQGTSRFVAPINPARDKSAQRAAALIMTELRSPQLQ
jgi:hypothetical protein